MVKNGMKKCRPLGGTYILYGALSLWLFLIWFCGYQQFENAKDIIIWLCIHAFWFLLGMVLILLSIYVWDVPIYIGEEGILRKRKKGVLFIRYEEIQAVQLTRFHWDRVHTYALKLHTDDEIIWIKVGEGLKCYDAFMKCCTNNEIIDCINKQMDNKGLCKNR